MNLKIDLATFDKFIQVIKTLRFYYVVQQSVDFLGVS